MPKTKTPKRKARRYIADSSLLLRFPDWGPKEQPTAEEREAFIACCRVTLLRPRATAELALAEIACALWNTGGESLIVLIVPVDREQTIIEVRNNG